MQFDRKIALKIWEGVFGKSVEGTDFTGRKINKSAYEQRNSKFGWSVTHLLPKSAGGKDSDENLLCVHIDTAQEKAEEYPFFEANDKRYEITYVIETEEWTIEEAHDSQAIAEQEEKARFANEKWDEIFGSEYDKAKDFCGRIIHRNEFGTDSEFAWKVAPYVDSKPMENKNVYIASVLSVEEALGKTAFKANGKSYTLNKDNGAYYFKALEVKPPKKVYDVRNPYDVAKKIESIKAVNAGDENVMLDFIVIKAVTRNNCSANGAQSIADTVSEILRDAACEPLAQEISEMADEHGARYMFITYRFAAATPADFERIFGGAQLLNTYSNMLLKSLGLVEFKIYNYACFVSRAHIRFPLGLLSGYYTQLGALMQSIYESAYGFYPSEPSTTLYVSHMIVFNVPYLAALHPQDSTQFYTEAYMAEHNYVEPELAEKIQRYLAGEPETAENAPVEISENEPTIAPATDENAENVEDSVSVAQENTDDVSDAVAEETVDETGEKPAEEVIEVPAEETAEVQTEQPADKPVLVEAEDAVTETNEPVTDETVEIEPEPEPEAEPEVEESPETEPEPEIEDHELKKTPEGDQLTMAFPTINEEKSEAAPEEAAEQETGKEDGEDEEDEILTLDLDAFM